MNRGLSEEAAAYGIALVEFNLLSLCVNAGESTATQLARLLPIDAARVSRVVTTLVDKGLLDRRRQRVDRRVVTLRPSDEGVNLVLELREAMQVYIGEVSQGIGEDAMREFRSVTLQLLSNHEARQQSVLSSGVQFPGHRSRGRSPHT